MNARIGMLPIVKFPPTILVVFFLAATGCRKDVEQPQPAKDDIPVEVAKQVPEPEQDEPASKEPVIRVEGPKGDRPRISVETPQGQRVYTSRAQ